MKTLWDMVTQGVPLSVQGTPEPSPPWALRPLSLGAGAMLINPPSCRDSLIPGRGGGGVPETLLGSGLWWRSGKLAEHHGHKAQQGAPMSHRGPRKSSWTRCAVDTELPRAPRRSRFRASKNPRVDHRIERGGGMGLLVEEGRGGQRGWAVGAMDVEMGAELGPPSPQRASRLQECV